MLLIAGVIQHVPASGGPRACITDSLPVAELNLNVSLSTSSPRPRFLPGRPSGLRPQRFNFVAHPPLWPPTTVSSGNGLSAPTLPTDLAPEPLHCQCGATKHVPTPPIATLDAVHVQYSQTDRRRRVLAVPGCCHPEDATHHQIRLCLAANTVSCRSHRSTERIEIPISSLARLVRWMHAPRHRDL